MRKFLLAAAAGLLVAPVAASAQDGYGSDTQDQPGMQQGQDRGIEQPESGALNPEPGPDVRTAAPYGKQDVQSQARQLFQGKVKTWDVEGTVSSVDSANQQITIQRENLPDVQLSLVDQSKISMDGKQASLQDLQPGSEIRASFQLAQDRPVAVSLDAKPSKAQKQQQKQQGQQPSGQGSMGGGMQ